MAVLRPRSSSAPLALLLAVVLVLVPIAGLAQEDASDEPAAKESSIADQLFGDDAESTGDLFGDDDLFGDESRKKEAAAEGDVIGDDFLDEEYLEEEEEQEKDALYWGFYVPVDILLSRPFALNDTVVGFTFFAAATPVIGLGSGIRSSWDYARGDGWYFDRGNLQWAWQACVTDPWGYLWDRPLGNLASEY